MIRYRRPVALLSLLLAPCCALAADEPESTTAARQARLAQIRGVLQTLRPTLLHEVGEAEAKLHSKPLLLYADNARDLANSSLWVWEHSGRPVGVTAIEWHVNGENQGRWTFEFASLCSDKIRTTLASTTWTADPASFAAIVNSPTIADTRPQRVQQMRKLADRFSVVEQHPREGRIQLRRLSAPVYTQRDAGDAAIFVFANGTNPEVAVLITVLRDGDREPAWGFRAAALSSTELSLLLDDAEVWSEVPFTRPGTREAYINGVLEVEPNDRSRSSAPE